jgi:Dyp-type peroxidase family
MPAVLDREDMQGLIARGYKKHPYSCFLLLRLGAEPNDIAATKQWLASLQVKDATRVRSDTYVNIAFTFGGLQRLGCPAAILSGFSDEFCGGMTARHRRRILGDDGDNAPEKWGWGNEAKPVDALVLVYARLKVDLDAGCASLNAKFLSCGIREVKKIETHRMPDNKEHFGFHDGIASPTIEGLGIRGIATSSPPVKAGEFILGYENEYQHYTARPVVDRVFDPKHLLKNDIEGTGGADFGRNGGYLVFRQLYQDVYGFWSFIDQAVTKLPVHSVPDPRSWLGAKMVGRWQSGSPIVLTPQYDESALAKQDQFLYRKQDPEGISCPIGAHIRRANPRDGFMLTNAAGSIALSKRHRMLRRGRSYGPPLAESMRPEDILARGRDDIDRGLCFICLTANISRQFEFIQGGWMNDPSFNKLHDDVDPLLGERGRFSNDNQQPPEGTFTIPTLPVRMRVKGLRSFVEVRGGAYFFLPGKAALQYLAQC